MNPRHEIHFHPNFREKSGHFQAIYVSFKKNNDSIPTLSHSHQRKNGQQEQGILCSRTISIEALSLIIETSTEEAHSLAAYCYRSEVFCQMRPEGKGPRRNKKRKLLVVANVENYTLQGTSLFCPRLLGSNQARG